MTKNTILWYNPKLKMLARQLRKNSTLAEIILWKSIKGKALDYEFHRQVAVNEFIIDFYCHELKLAIEVDGYTHDYNFENDYIRQKKLESFGITFVRFTDEDVKRHINDVIRALQIIISELEKRLLTSPPLPSKGE
jgi:very-short-patch-repair endonuclease